MAGEADANVFSGFADPEANFCRLPLSIIENMSLFSSKAEICVVLYILRHTWGYREYEKPKAITVDEFVKGRKRKDGTRIDSGTGLTPPSIRSGLESAEKHGFITVEVDDTDMGRIKKSYCLKMAAFEEKPQESSKSSQMEKSLLSDGKLLSIRGKEVLPRTEIDTLDKDLEIEREQKIPAPIVADAPPTPEPTIIEENTPALTEGSGKILAFTSQTETDEDTPRRKPRKSAPVHDALIAAFGLNNQKMTRSADSVYWKAATELQDFPVDRVEELYRYVKRKASAEQWRGFTVNALAKYAPEFLRDNPYKIEYIVDDSALPKAAGAEGDAIPISADKKVEAERLMSELLAKMNGNGVKRGSTNGR